MSTEPTQREEEVTEPQDLPARSLAANATAHAGATPAVEVAPERVRPPVHVAGKVLPAWAPWGIVAATGAVLALVFAATGFNLAGWIVTTVLVGGLAQYVISRVVEGPRRATDRGATYAIVAAFLLA